MTIKLIIENKNTEAVDVNIYRSDTEIDRTALPTPVGTISQTTDNPIEWVDDTAAQHASYYYVIETIGAEDQSISRNHQLQMAQTRGAGGNLLKYGDKKLGFFDSINADSLLNANALFAQLGLTEGTANAFTFWFKFAHNNVVKYVPNAPAGYNVSYADLAAAGAVDGTKTFTINGNVYKLQLMEGYDGTNLPPEGGDMDDETHKSMTNEFNDLVHPMVRPIPLSQRVPNSLQLDPSSIFTADHFNVLIKETDGEGLCGARGAVATDRTCVTTTHQIATDDATTTIWWPVLVLDEGGDSEPVVESTFIDAEDGSELNTEDGDSLTTE